MNRLTRRQKLVIGGCAFACLAAGLSLGTCHARAATVDIACTSAASDYTIGLSDLAWAASDGGMTGIPPLGAAQEVITGGHREQLLVSGPARYRSVKGLNNTEIIRFGSGNALDSEGPGIYEESHWVDSCGSAASGADCASGGELNQDGANFTATPYCERLVTTNSFMADRLAYRSSGNIVQADSEIPDSLLSETNATGHGTGSFRAVGMTKAGIGATDELGYVNEVNERISAGGNFDLAEKVRWTSFRKSFDVPGYA
jgi:hypothetical protein